MRRGTFEWLKRRRALVVAVIAAGVVADLWFFHLPTRPSAFQAVIGLAFTALVVVAALLIVSRRASRDSGARRRHRDG